MLRNHRQVALIVVPLLLAAAIIDHDGVSIGLSVLALTVVLAALGSILWARRASRRSP